MLQEAVKNKFSMKQVLIPPDAGSAVLKGAVIYGHDPRTIKERVCKYTYGLRTTRRFDKTLHAEKYRKVINGVDRCRNVFGKHVQIGETVVVGEPRAEMTGYPAYANQKRTSFHVFASTNADPMYTTDEGCVKLGKLCLDMPDITGGTERELKVQMIYSGTELAVKATDVTSGNTVKGSFDFLG